jgi:protein phosphatase 1G
MCADRLVGYIDKHHTTGDYERALTDAFIAMDSYINSAPGWKELEKLTAESGGARMCDGADTAATMGTTCCLVLITPTEIYCANIGDSRAVLSRKGAAVDLSIDHKPEIYSERLRIETAGGYVENNRVNGALNLARSFGDFQYKGKEGFKASEQMVISVPEIKSEKLKDADFIIVACDGIWDCMSSKEAVDFVIANNTDTTSTTKKLSVIVNKMLDTCLAKDIGPGNSILSSIYSFTHFLGGKGCDNMTCIIIEFKK